MPSLSAKRTAQHQRLHVPQEQDPHPGRSGVLLSDEIRLYAAQFGLIDPFDIANLRAASYELTIGDEYFLNGEFRRLDEKDTLIRIPPFEVVVLKTAEILSMPRFLIARWNIKVSLAYSGLLWVGGPQVDPGYVGNLFCPIYNLSDKEVTLHIGDPIAVIDFVKTTAFDPTKPLDELLRFPFPPRRLIIEDYPIADLRSALFTVAGQKLVEFEQEIAAHTDRLTRYTQITFAVFSLIFATLAIISRTNVERLSLSASIWGAATVAASAFAVLVSIFSHLDRRVGRLVYDQYGRIIVAHGNAAMRFLRRRWWAGLTASLLISGIGAGVLYIVVDPYFTSLRQQRAATTSDLHAMSDSLTVEFGKLARRVTQLEQTRTVTSQDLDIMEKEIQRLRAVHPK
jgi:deoxycytidine triphosphate deaminase